MPRPKKRNHEQTLALRIQTKGSDPSEMLLFHVVGCKKRVKERGKEQGRKKGGKGEEKGEEK